MAHQKIITIIIVQLPSSVFAESRGIVKIEGAIGSFVTDEGNKSFYGNNHKLHLLWNE